MVDDEDILELARQRTATTSTKAVKALVAAANRSGGEDNITVVAFRIVRGRARAGEDTVETLTLAGDASSELEDTIVGGPATGRRGGELAHEPIAARPPHAARADDASSCSAPRRRACSSGGCVR